MNDLLREEVEKEIHELNSNLAEINDGIELSKLIASEVLKITQSAVTTANSTDSVDERLKCLVTGLQASVRFTEGQVEEITKKTETIQLEISTLRKVIAKIDFLDSEKKK